MNEANKEDDYKIYMHRNKINGKIYIGQTKQKPENRWRNGEGYKKSPYFYNAIRKYGWDNFEHIILIENLDRDNANILEEKLIKEYNTTDDKYGYNLSSGGGSPVMNELARQHCRENRPDINGANNPMYGKHHTEETKEKIRKTKEKYIGKNATRYGAVLSDETKKKIGDGNRGKIIPKETIKKMVDNNPNRNPVFQIDIVFRKIVGEYESASHASRETGVKSSQISACCNNTPKYISAGGYIWMYCEDYNKKYYSKDFWDRYKVIGQYDERYNLINRWAFPREIRKQLGIKNTAYISSLCKKEKFENMFFGFHWKYEVYDMDYK